MKKRIYGVILVLCMIALVLSACGGNNSGTTPTSTTPAESTAAASTAAEKTPAGPPAELKVMCTAFGAIPTDLQKVVDEINKIAIAEINVKIELMPISISAYQEQARLMLSAKETLDLFLTGTLGRFDYVGEISRGQLTPLDELVDKYGDNIKTVLGKYLDASRFQGKLYGLTTMRDLSGSNALYFSKDLVDKYKYDLSTIKKWQDIEPLLADIKKNEPNVLPFTTARTPEVAYSFSGIDNLGTTWGLGLEDITKPVVSCYYFGQKWLDNVKVLHDWYKKGYIPSDIATATTFGPDYLKAGRAFVFSGGSKPAEATQYEKQSGKKVYTVVIDKNMATTDSTLRFLWAIPSHSKNPEAAMKFLNLMYGSEKVINLFQWGIEGTHYVKNPDGSIKYPDGKDATNVGYALNANWLWGDQLKEYIFEGDSLTFPEDMRKYNESADLSVGMGFIFDPNPVKTEIAGITNLVKQYAPALQNGQADPAKVLPEFQSKLKAAGIEKCVAEAQKQFDAWLASKK